MKYFMHYVDDCTPKIKYFKTEREMRDFTLDFLLKHQLEIGNGGYWIDIMAEGKTTFVSTDLTEGLNETHNSWKQRY